MLIATIKVSGVHAEVISCTDIPAGLVGGQIQIEYDDSVWSDLRKTVVFKGYTTVDIITDAATIVIPPEVVSRQHVRLSVGILGTSPDGAVVVPTLWADLGIVKPATDPSGDNAADPQLPIWAQLLHMIGDLNGLDTAAKDSLVAAVNEVLGKAGTGGSGGNADQSGLTAEQISALDGMFKICAYTADTTDAYKAFQTAFGIGGSGGGEVEPDVPVGPEEPETGVSNEATWTDGVAYDISWTDGIYIGLNGEEKTYSGWKATQYLYCDGAAKLTISNTAGSPGEYSSFYDVNKVYISSFSGGAINTNDHIIPENAVYFRVSCITNNVSNIIPHARV